MSLYAFYFLSFLAILSALMVVFSKNPIYSVLYLVITFFAVACHYLLLGAQFLAVVHVIVYAGAILVLFLYVIMLLNLNKEEEPTKNYLQKFAAVISAGTLLVVFVGALRGLENQHINFDTTSAVGTVKNLGQVLFNDFLLPFEMASILLLSAMVGAVMLAKGHRKRLEGNPVKKTATSPVVNVKNDVLIN